MKALLSSLVLAAGFAGASVAQAEGLCETGLEAFKATVYPEIRTQPCRFCHESGPGPAYDSPDPEVAYLAVKNYVDFEDIDSSRLVFRAGNGHQGCAACNLEQRARIRGLIQDWWDQGEMQCVSEWQKFTLSQPIPADLPKDRFVQMSWDLRSLDVSLAGLKLQVDAKRLVDHAPPTPGAYLFRKPRLVATGAQRPSIEVNGMRLLLNRKHQATANAFERIGTVVTANSEAQGAGASYPVLTPETIALTQELEAGDAITVSFRKLAPAPQRQCNELEMFESLVMPAVEARACKACHANMAENAPPIARQARSLFKMSDDAGELCADFLERTWSDEFIFPTLFQYPLYGRFEHPRIFASSDEIMPDWIEWMRAEHERMQ